MPSRSTIVCVLTVLQGTLHVVDDRQDSLYGLFATVQYQFGLLLQRALAVVVKLGGLIEYLCLELFNLFLGSLQRVCLLRLVCFVAILVVDRAVFRCLFILSAFRVYEVFFLFHVLHFFFFHSFVDF